MGAIFLSYAREDRASAQNLARVLESAGHSVWWDRHLDGGQEFSAEIEAALGQSDVVVVAWTSNSVKSRWVRDEAAVGGDTGKLVPVSMDGTLPPMGFRQFHTLELNEWKGGRRDKRTAELLHSVERRLKENGKVVAATLVAQPKRHVGSFAAGRMWAAAAIAALLLAIGAFLFVSGSGNAPTSAPSVAVLPFSADSSDADARKLAAATRDAVAQTLSQGAFAVSTIDAVPQGARAPADFVISGRTSTTPDKVVTNVRMEETGHHLVVFTHQFETARDKAWNLPEQVGAQVASQLSWTASMIAMEKRHPSDPAIVASLLQSGSDGFGSVSDLADYEKSRRMAASAPNSPLAQNQFAFNTAFILDQIPREDRPDALAAARRAADRTIELAPEFGGAYIPWCFLRSEQRMMECEAGLRKGMRVDPDSSFTNWFLSRLLNNAGRNIEAAELAKLSLAHDPYMPYKIAQMLRMLETTGQTEEAAKLYEQSKQWWPDNDTIRWYRISGMILRGDFDIVQQFNREVQPKAELDRLLSAINSKSLARTRSACPAQVAADEVKGFMCMLALARYGDPDAAFAIADRLYPSRRGRTPAEEERIWLDKPGTNMLAFLTSPVAAPLRRDPRYVALAERVGLLEYWRSGRPPDFCRKQPEPICPQLLNAKH